MAWVGGVRVLLDGCGRDAERCLRDSFRAKAQV